MLERPVACGGATEVTDEEWCEALCAMGGTEVRELAGLAQRKLESCAVVDAELQRGGSALLAGNYGAAKQRFCSALASCESATLERCAVERAQAAASGLEQAEKGLKFAAMSEDDLIRAHAQVMDDEALGHQLGISGGGGTRTASASLMLGGSPLSAPTAAPGGPQGRPKAPLAPYPGPSRATPSMFSIYWRMPKGEPAPMSFDVECVASLSPCRVVVWAHVFISRP